MSTSAKYSAVSQWFGFDTLDPERFVTSYFVSPATLLCIRSVIALYVTWGLGFSIYYNIYVNTIKIMFAYFTNLTYVGLWGYFVSSVIHSIFYNIRHDASSFKNHFYIASSQWVLYHTVIVANILTPVVFWAFLSNSLVHNHSSAANWYTNINIHALTLIWMLTDVILTRQRITWRMFLFPLTIVILFVFEAWLTHDVDGIWVYSFLSWSQGPIAAAWYIGIGVFVVVIFAVQIYMIHPLRDFLGRKYGRYYIRYLETSVSFDVDESQKGYVVTEKSFDNPA